MAKPLADLFDNVDMFDQDACDVRWPKQVSAAFLTVDEPDVVINLAGVSHVQPLANSSHSDWLEEVQTNLIGSYNIATSAIERNPKATMIFIGSVAGKYGKPNHSGYCASKAGVISLVQSLGMEGYNAYAISPGRVDTKMRQKDYPNDTPGSRLSTHDIASVVKEIVDGKHTPGDNLIIRKQGLVEIIRETDDGEPWKTRLKVGQPVTI